jgi:glycosyl transferase family 25
MESLNIYVINLDQRTDRLEQITKELGDMGLKFKRFPAIKTTPGILGCGLSHLAVLKEARDLGLKNVLIFEDDFKFLIGKEEFHEKIENFLRSESFDLVMLAYLVQKSEPVEGKAYIKVLNGQTASGYIVNERFYGKLIDLYEEAMPLLKSTGQHWNYANDSVWKKLQPAADWFAFVPRMGYQRASMSDNDHHPVFKDYGV